MDARAIFGWKVVMEVWGIKYRIMPKDCENLPDLPKEFGDRQSDRLLLLELYLRYFWRLP